MKNKIILITGATSGIGKVATFELAKQEATIIFTTRDIDKGKQVKEEIIQLSGNHDIHDFFCDFASLESIKTFCNEFKSKFDQLHILINNAAVWNPKRKLSDDGFEHTFAVNYLAPFLLTNLLLDTIKASQPSRIVNVVSGLHQGSINFDDIEFKNTYSGFKVYRQSKLALMLYTRLLAKKLEGLGVSVNCVQPGMTRTHLGRDSGWSVKMIFKLIGKSIEKGAETVIYAALSKEIENISGEYLQNKAIAKSSDESKDLDMAERLVKVSEQYVGL